MGLFSFLNPEKVITTEMDTTRAIERVGDDEQVAEAVAKYESIQNQIRLVGSSTSEDRTLVEKAEEELREVLRKKGVELAFVKSPFGEGDDAVTEFVKYYNETPEVGTSVEEDEDEDENTTVGYKKAA